MNLTVSALASITGVPANTLRTWERRYGLGAVARTEGGQRLYDQGAVDHVRLAARAIAQGHRPSMVLPSSAEDIRAMLGELPPVVLKGRGSPSPSTPPPPARPAPPPIHPEHPWDHPWLAPVAALDAHELSRLWRGGLGRLGVEAFITQEVAPFLGAVGRAWVDGRVQVFEEHFAAEALGEFLARTWGPMAEVNDGPVAICATLPGEHHLLALHMVACIAAAAGWRIVFLGRDTPPPDLLAAVERIGARAVLLSFAARTNPGQSGWELAALRERLPRDVVLAVGGAGTPAELPAGVAAPGLEQLAPWLASLRR